MAFYEFPQKRKYRVIRCHGSRNIGVVKRMLIAWKRGGKMQRLEFLVLFILSSGADFRRRTRAQVPRLWI